MTDTTAGGHEAWDELAAGHALNALEPDDEQRFLAHLAGCRTCTATVDDFALVAAQLGALSDGETDESPSWQQLRSAIVNDGHVTALHTRRPHRRAPRLIAAAAAVVAVAGGTVAGWQATHGSAPAGTPGTAALSACAHQTGCHVVRLHTSNGESPAAVLVNGDGASVVPLALAPAPAGRTYVLWQMPRDGSPIPVSEFRDTVAQTAPTRLSSDYADTAAFAISIESASVVPSRPTKVIALGTPA